MRRTVVRVEMAVAHREQWSLLHRTLGLEAIGFCPHTSILYSKGVSSSQRSTTANTTSISNFSVFPMNT